MLVTLRITGDDGRVDLLCDTDKLHKSWIEKCLAYGVRRLPNDSHSGAKGADKVEAVRLMLNEMQSGNEAPVRVANTTSRDPVEALAVKTAKSDLIATFKIVTGKTRALDFAKHEKIAPFFTEDKDKAVWIEKTVLAWIAKQKETNKRDYVAEAKKTLDSAIGDKIDLDF